jgi:hypothetical protein
MTILDQPTIMIGLGGKIQMVSSLHSVHPVHFFRFISGDVGGINTAPCSFGCAKNTDRSSNG